MFAFYISSSSSFVVHAHCFGSNAVTEQTGVQDLLPALYVVQIPTVRKDFSQILSSKFKAGISSHKLFEHWITPFLLKYKQEGSHRTNVSSNREMLIVSKKHFVYGGT
jgi:hypothetical protein